MTRPNHGLCRTKTWSVPFHRAAPCALMVAASMLVAPEAFSKSAPLESAQAKLGVMIVFDQLRPDELERYAPLFGPGGFGGLVGRGAAQHVAEYSYAATETGPGHATISTGANPWRSGVPTNRWPNAARDGWTYVVEDTTAAVIGGDKDTVGLSPKNLAAPTLADAIKEFTFGRGQVATFAVKDRAAILMGGHGADLAVWYDAKQGAYTSSTYYTKALPAWLAGMAKSRPAAARKNGTWAPLFKSETSTRRKAAFKALLPDDKRDGEGNPYEYGNVFPHDLNKVKEDVRARAYRGTPHAVADLLAMALKSVQEMKLGQDSHPDLLVIGLSPTDFAGHWWGPDSLEYADLLVRTDSALREFFLALDREVGRSRYVIGVTADHGAPGLPETTKAATRDGGRVHGRTLEKQLTEKAATVAPGAKVMLRPPHVFIGGAALTADAEKAAIDAVAVALGESPGIVKVYAPAALDHDDPYVEAYRRIKFPGRSGQLYVRQMPYGVFSWEEPTGIDHGSPYGYDKRVPFWVAGRGVQRGRYARAVDVCDVTPTMAFLLGVPPPRLAEGHPVSTVEPASIIP